MVWVAIFLPVVLLFVASMGICWVIWDFKKEDRRLKVQLRDSLREIARLDQEANRINELRQPGVQNQLSPAPYEREMPPGISLDFSYERFTGGGMNHLEDLINFTLIGEFPDEYGDLLLRQIRDVAPSFRLRESASEVITHMGRQTTRHHTIGFTITIDDWSNLPGGSAEGEYDDVIYQAIDGANRIWNEFMTQRFGMPTAGVDLANIIMWNPENKSWNSENAVEPAARVLKKPRTLGVNGLGITKEDAVWEQ